MPGFEELWFNKRDVLEQKAKDTEIVALCRAGWNHTSQTPCSVWMWQKDIGGTRYSVDQPTAAAIQEREDRREYFKQFPDELAD